MCTRSYKGSLGVILICRVMWLHSGLLFLYKTGGVKEGLVNLEGVELKLERGGYEVLRRNNGCPRRRGKESGMPGRLHHSLASIF